MNYNLTDEQYSHFESAKWLYFGPRAVGRTRVLASVFIDYALHHMGKRVYIVDHHYPGKIQARQVLLNEIVKIIDQNNEERKQQEKTTYQFLYYREYIIFKGMKYSDEK